MRAWMRERVRDAIGALPSSLRPEPQETAPFSLGFGPEGVDFLEQVGARCGGLPPAEVVKKSLVVLDHITRRLEQGCIFQMVDCQGKVFHVVFVGVKTATNAPAEDPKAKFRVIRGGMDQGPGPDAA